MLHEQMATEVGPARLSIAYETHGDAEHPTVLLIMGLAAQMVHWPDGFLDALVKRQMHLVRFDNRDAGHSSYMNQAPRPDFPAVLRGDFASASYTLSDMAADGIGLLDKLGIETAHLVGASLGGAVAQTMALEHPGRVLSLTSIMSTTGNMKVGQVHPATMQSVFGGPKVNTRDEFIARTLRIRAVVGSPAFPANPEDVAELAGLAYDRGHDEIAMVRQAIASVASGDRTERLAKLDIPTLVVHGLADTMCESSGGRATAAAIPGAELALIDRMGHDLPAALWEQLADLIHGVVQRGQERRSQARVYV